MVPQGPTSGNASLPQSTSVENGAASATAAGGVAQPLRELLGRPVATWVDHGFERIKERTVRSVFRGALGDVPVHVKLFRADKLSDRARDSLRGSRGQRESEHLHQARALGLPAVEPVAFGMVPDGEDLRSFVATRSVPGGTAFDFDADPAVQARAGALLRRMHELGAVASDLHPGNLIVDAAGEPWLIDLTSFRHAGEPGLEQRARALAQFCQPLDGGALDHRARQLLAAYRAAGAELPTAFTKQLRLATHRWRAAALPRFGRRSTRNCRHTEADAKQRGKPRWFWHLADDDAARRERCREFAAAPPAPTKSGRRGAVWIATDIVMKRRNRGAARKLWRAAYWLLFAGVDAPRPIALRLDQEAGMVFAERIANPSLDRELADGDLDAAAIAACARALGVNVGRMHANGLRNRDLKFENLVRVPGSDRIAMVDLDGVRRKSAIDMRGCGADLGRLLAAFRHAGSPGGAANVRAFLRGWRRAHRDLLQRPPWRRVLRRAEQRAGEWLSAHARGDT